MNLSGPHRARLAALRSLTGWLIFVAVLVWAHLREGDFFQDWAYTEVIGPAWKSVTREDVATWYRILLLVITALILVGVGQEAWRIASLTRFMRWEEGVHQEQVNVIVSHYEAAVQQFEAVRYRHEQAVAEAVYQRDYGPQWFPVSPVAQPTRVDVFGGDPLRHGWASLLVTIGTAMAGAGQRVTVVDLSGHDVGGGLLEVTRAYGLATHRVSLAGRDAHVNLLDTVPRAEIADCLAYVLVGRLETADLRQERALVREIVHQVIDCVEDEVTFAKIAAGIQALRGKTPAAGVLTPAEEVALTDRVVEIGDDDSTVRQMRFMASQLRSLDAGAGGPDERVRLWSDAAVSVITTPGGRHDRKELLDRLVVHLAQTALDHGSIRGLLVVAGVDQLGAQTLQALSEHARQAGVRLMMLADHPQGEMEKMAGTGGVACFMKAYNHHDARIAAEFIGREHKFVLSQTTVQVGENFTESSNDGVSENENDGTSSGPQASSTTHSRGVTWTTGTTHSTGTNTSDSQTRARVHEFRIEPEQLQGMPATSMVLIDNASGRRRVTMIDSNPGISMLGPRVSLTPHVKALS